MPQLPMCCFFPWITGDPSTERCPGTMQERQVLGSMLKVEYNHALLASRAGDEASGEGAAGQGQGACKLEASYYLSGVWNEAQESRKDDEGPSY
jgi:hypothetical protein